MNQIGKIKKINKANQINKLIGTIRTVISTSHLNKILYNFANSLSRTYQFKLDLKPGKQKFA